MLTKFGWQRAHRLHLAARAHNCPRCPQGFSSVLLSMAHEPAAAMSPENRLEMQSLGVSPGPPSPNLESLGGEPRNLQRNRLGGAASAHSGGRSPGWALSLGQGFSECGAGIPSVPVSRGWPGWGLLRT